MFTLERKSIKTESNIIIDRNKNIFNSILNEADIEYSNYVDRYKNMVETSLKEANYVYNEHVQSNLKDYCMESLNNAVKALETSIDILHTYKNIIANEVAYIKGINKKVIEIYEPLLKRLDRHKYGYQVPEYALNELEPHDIFSRVQDFLDKKVGITKFDIAKPFTDDMIGIIDRYLKNEDEYYDQLTHSVLGVPNSYNTSDFKEVVRTFLVKDNNLQMKRIGDDLFKTLREEYINIESIDKVIGYIQREIFIINELKSELSNSNCNYYIYSVYTNALVIRTNLVVKCLEYIEEIIRMKIRIFEEMSINYRKVIIDGYDKISSDPESVEGIYNPANDESILQKHAEYLSGHRIIATK